MVKIICEGGDDHSFLKLFLEHLNEDKSISNSINNFGSYIQPMGGKSNLLNKEKYETINKQIGKKIKKVLFIFDCDFLEDDAQCGDIDKSKECIEKLIQQLDWKIEIDYYIFSKNLDYFLIDTLENKESFESCEECLELKKVNKNRKILTCIYNKLYPNAPYNFSNDKFDDIKQKLKNLFEEQ
ncbi:MAG: hypothetical protein ACI9RG_000222 [Sulfurimonas sp.]|jgi:hypothetical protein